MSRAFRLRAGDGDDPAATVTLWTLPPSRHKLYRIAETVSIGTYTYAAQGSSMERTRLVLVGGFLGAGKTTTIGRLAGLYRGKGLRVAVITNDQASNLVDTQNLQRQGYDVQEVSQACFCCAFPRLIDCATQLAVAHPPDVILGEPVGSCTDLAATVVQPLKRLYSERYLVAPLLVLVDPDRARPLMQKGRCDGFSSQVAYIYQKQLEEADVIAVNKIDTLAADEVEELESQIAARFPQASVVAISARTGVGLDHLVEVLESAAESGRHIAEVDYDVYAAGEAELGWLNSALTLSSATRFDMDSVLFDILSRLSQELRQAGAEVAHLKAIAMAADREAVANWVRTEGEVELSKSSQSAPGTAELIVNARVVLDPDELARLLEKVVMNVATETGLEVRWGASRRLRPGRPVPTYRFSEPL